MWADRLTEAQLRGIISAFYDRVYAHPTLSLLFRHVRQRRQEQRLFGFMRVVLSEGRSAFANAYLCDAHAHLFITEDLFDLREDLLEEAIRACGFGDEIVIGWRLVDLQWRRDIVKARIEECTAAEGGKIVAIEGGGRGG